MKIIEPPLNYDPKQVITLPLEEGPVSMTMADALLFKDDGHGPCQGTGRIVGTVRHKDGETIKFGKVCGCVIKGFRRHRAAQKPVIASPDPIPSDGTLVRVSERRQRLLDEIAKHEEAISVIEARRKRREEPYRAKLQELADLTAALAVERSRHEASLADLAAALRGVEDQIAILDEQRAILRNKQEELRKAIAHAPAELAAVDGGLQNLYKAADQVTAEMNRRTPGEERREVSVRRRKIEQCQKRLARLDNGESNAA